VRSVVGRVVVPLDAASEHGAAIETAARLAHRWHARLHGVFVEDEDLMRLARLPFARQISLGFGIERLTADHLRRELHAFAAAAQRELALAARRHAVEWSFEIAPETAGNAAFAVTERDLLVAGSLTRPIGPHFRVECRWWHMPHREAVSFLLVRREWEASGAVAALLHDREPGAERVLATAAHCAEAAGGVLTVTCPAALAGAAGFEDWLAERLAPYAVRVQIELAPDEPEALLEHLAKLDCQLLALGSESIEARPDQLRKLAARANCGILIVR
jgi:hypothetical protein